MYPPAAQNQAQLDLFRDRLPKKPYCSDDLDYGLRIRAARNALKSRYVQPNGPTHKYWLVFDVDRAGAMYDWSDRRAPPPNIIVINPDNNHGHLIYGLEVPVRTADDGRGAALRYAGAVDVALAELLGADRSYSGLICKNPLHESWYSHVWEDRLYTLDDLSSWLDLKPYNDRRKNLPAYGLGRNSTLFDRLRHWAYRSIREERSYDEWMFAVAEKAIGYNDFSPPLDTKEVMHVAKSVGRWVYKNMSSAGFSEWQAAQGAKGGKAKGKALREQLMPVVAEMWQQGFTKADIAREVGQSKMTIGNWIKRLDSPQNPCESQSVKKE